jgi:hypothetical protein
MSKMPRLLFLVRGFEYAIQPRLNARLGIEFLLRRGYCHAPSAGTLKERIGWQRQVAAFGADEPVAAHVP